MVLVRETASSSARMLMCVVPWLSAPDDEP